MIALLSVRTSPTRSSVERFCGKDKSMVDSEGDFLEVTFEQKEGYFRETNSDQVMEKVDMDGKVIGFSILNVSALRENPIDVDLVKLSGRG